MEDMIAKEKIQFFISLGKIIFAGGAICTAIGGCHPCVVTQCSGDERPPNLGPLNLPTIFATAYTNASGNVFIDIPSNSINKPIKILNISIRSTGEKQESTIFWEIAAPRHNQENIGDINIFPLQYGIDLPSIFLTLHPPRKLEPGPYAVTGSVIVRKNGTLFQMRLVGNFFFQQNKVFNSEKPPLNP
jgi:hypothetical protein